MLLQQVAMQQLRSTIHLSTGVTLHFLEQGDEGGEVVIMLHGYSDSSYSFSRVLPLLSQHYHIFAIDQRGHGDSTKIAARHTMQDFADDVVAFMDAKRIARATVVGHSMGTIVAQLVAIQQPERVSRLVLIGATVSGGHESVLELNAAVQTLVDPIDPAFVREFQDSTVFHTIPQEFFERVVVESLKVPARVWHEAAASIVQQNTTSGLPNIKAPTLIIWGNQDLIAPYSDQVTLHEIIPNATLRVYEQIGHAPNWEVPHRLVADLEEFLRHTNE